MPEPKRGSSITGLAALVVLATLGTGIAGLVVGFMALDGPVNYTGSALGSIAAALAFGLLANALLRE